MDIKIQNIDFSATEQLKEYVEKRVTKLERFYADIINAAVVLTLTKPEASKNKKARITLSVKGPDIFSEKEADFFEEAVTMACEALEPQLERLKDKHRKE